MADERGQGLSVKDIAWVAGLLEGEGCFQPRAGRQSPLIQLAMTDMDVVVKAAKILGTNRVVENAKPTKRGKPIYRTVVFGRNAVSWCMTLYPLMGERRQAKIRELLAKWKKSPSATYLRKNCSSRGAKQIWENPDFINKAA
jgi:hypothetical protein